eukprot:Skav209167  [mRNA]  locus=scaffold1137:371809:374157:+ [translate_table: standard]
MAERNDLHLGSQLCGVAQGGNDRTEALNDSKVQDRLGSQERRMKRRCCFPPRIEDHLTCLFRSACVFQEASPSALNLLGDV